MGANDNRMNRMTNRFQGTSGTPGRRGCDGVTTVRQALPFSLLLLLCTPTASFAQHHDKPRPEAWEHLAFGGRFMDRILPAPIFEGLEADPWGTDKVRPRDIHNGIEDPDWSYWGGRPILEPDGKYHLFVARWREDNPRGHAGWPDSEIVQAVSDRPTGPFAVKQVIGPGHFPEVQYHAIVNDWYGRTAYHFRSKDGVNWTMDPGEAYTIDFDGYEDDTKVRWYKYERPKVMQDQYGRATHLYLAVIDVPKKQDLGKDDHSSKNIVLPLLVGRRLQILNPEKLTAHTKTIRLRILAEEGFDPHAEVDIDRLRFGAPEKVDFGGGCKAVKSEKSGKDLIVTFDAVGHGITNENFAAKLIGQTARGRLLFGYSRLPGVDYSPHVVGR